MNVKYALHHVKRKAGPTDYYESRMAQPSNPGGFKEWATRIVETLRARGFQAYFVGGCVRDLLLGRDPKDYDVATDATPNQVMDIFPETYAVGAQFGVVLVPVDHASAEACDSERHSSRGECVEVATFRSDIGYSDGRHPDEVRFSETPQEDVARRDFTI